VTHPYGARVDAARWRELFVAADLLAQVRIARPLIVELLRPQASFNHALLDLLGRWPQVGQSPADLARELDRLEVLALAGPRAIPSHRAGRLGRAVTLAKRLATPLALLAARRRFAAQRAQNLARVAALRSKSATVTAPARLFAAQARFERLLDLALPDILRLDSYATAYREWVEQVEPTLLPPQAPVPTPPVSIVCEATPSPQALAAIATQPGSWECLIATGTAPADPRFRCGGLDAAKGEWILWLSRDVVLATGALSWFLGAATGPNVDLAYADEDQLGRLNPFFKPGWCTELASERDLLGGAVWVRRSATQGATPLEWAMALPRQRVCRIPAVLSHRSTPSPLVPRRTRRRVSDGARVTAIVPFKDKPELTEQLFASVQRHGPGVDVDWVLIDNGSVFPETAQKVGAIQARTGATLLRDAAPFNFSRLNNLGARHARGSHLLFLNNDVEAASDGWLSVLMEYACIPDVGVVGANLWYPDGTLQHSGVAIGVKGLAGHVFARHHERLGPTPFGTPFQTRQVSAVTGACLLIKRHLFEQLGGFDERLPISGNDVDLCLRATAAGFRVLNVPHVKLIHHESLTRTGIALSAENIAREREAYAPLLREGDPFYNPNLTALFTSCAPNLEGSRRRG
jgi:O-antigen biosynthesis protein